LSLAASACISFLVNGHPIPKALRNSPLQEVLFELRFKPSSPNVGDILPGLLFGRLGTKYPRVESLPFASVPRQVRENQEELRFQASHRLVGTHGAALLVGDRMSAAATTSYTGWTDFRSRVCELLETLASTALVSSVERFSFRYINILPAPPHGSQLSQIALNASLMGRPLLEQGLIVRTEVEVDGFTSVVQIAPNTSAKGENGLIASGLLLDIDTISGVPEPDFLRSPSAALDAAHAGLKKIFFGILTSDGLARLEPEYS